MGDNNKKQRGNKMNDRFKFRVIRGENPFTPTGTVLHFALGDEVGFGQGDIIEQCTGLKDKNGNLIYEGDILDCELQDIDSHGYPFIHFKKGVVKRAKNGAYCVEGDDDFYASDITLYPIEIIGNIHKQAEQKD